MFQFAGFPPQHYGISPFHPAVHEGSSCGFPHSDTCGSLDICSSPQLFAACRVFLRLLVPRHPPCALLVLNLLFSGSFCFSLSVPLFLFLFLLLFDVSIFCLRFFSDPVFGFQGAADLGQKYSKSKVYDTVIHSGDGGVRTLDPLLARQVLSQLSYIPTAKASWLSLYSFFDNLAASCSPMPSPA